VTAELPLLSGTAEGEPASADTDETASGDTAEEGRA
jgi:hypothetical protein